MIGKMYTESHKVEREIKAHGNKYTFYRDIADTYKETTGEVEEVDTINGLLHITKGYVNKNTQDGSVIRTKGQPMLLALFEDARKLEQGCYTIINDKKYIVNDVTNINEYNIIVDISLEVVV